MNKVLIVMRDGSVEKIAASDWNTQVLIMDYDIRDDNHRAMVDQKGRKYVLTEIAALHSPGMIRDAIEGSPTPGN